MVMINYAMGLQMFSMIHHLEVLRRFVDFLGNIIFAAVSEYRFLSLFSTLLMSVYRPYVSNT